MILKSANKIRNVQKILMFKSSSLIRLEQCPTYFPPTSNILLKLVMVMNVHSLHTVIDHVFHMERLQSTKKALRREREDR